MAEPGLMERLQAAEERARASEAQLRSSEEQLRESEAKAAQLAAQKGAALQENQMLAQRLHTLEGAASATPSSALVPTSSPARAQGTVSEWVSQSWRPSYGHTPAPLVRRTPELSMTRVAANLADELQLLVPLCGPDVASDETTRRAVRWGSEMGVTCMHDIAVALLFDEFVAALHLKLAPARILREVLCKGQELVGEIHKAKGVGTSRDAMMAFADLFLRAPEERVPPAMQRGYQPALEA